jgi:hypothetical protein
MKGKAMTEAKIEPPHALTERHLLALERAIIAEGYRIMVDLETGAVKLEKPASG